MAIWSRFFGNAASSAAGFGIGAAVSPALRPVTQEVANETWQRYPNRPLSPGDAAEAVIRDVLSADDAANEASMSGFDGERFATMRALAGEPPGAQQLLELWNRGELSEAAVNRGLRQSRMRPEWYDAYKALRHVLVPVSDRIRMAVREVLSPALRKALDLDAEFPEALLEHTRQLGLADSDARDYWAGHWQLPSREEGAAMWFRGELSEAQYDSLLKALDYAPVWRGPLKAITKAIPSLTQMERLAVREVYNPTQRKALGLDQDYPAEFTTQAAKHGLSEDDARDIWAGHWQLPSPTQAYHMLWRGEISQAQLDALLKALDYSPTWRDKLASIAHIVPGRVDLRRMHALNIIDRAELVQGYIRIGYAPDDAETMAKLAEALGTGAGDSHVEKAKAQLWTATHRSFVNGESDDATATAALAVVGVPAAERDDVLTVWQHEAALVRKQLTPAQVKKAYTKPVKNEETGANWTRDDAVAALIERGYSHSDANTFLDE